MRYLLILALLLYNIADATRPNIYDYDDPDSIKPHSFLDERRNWRKKALLKPFEVEHKEWDDRRYEHDIPRYLDDVEPKRYTGSDRRREMDPERIYKEERRYEDADNVNNMLRTKDEVGHNAALPSNENEKNIPFVMTCDRTNERYEACFAGCAAVSCDNPRERLRPCYPFCESGCVCVQPYVRDDRTHKCVQPEECTKMFFTEVSKGFPTSATTLSANEEMSLRQTIDSLQVPTYNRGSYYRPAIQIETSL